MVKPAGRKTGGTVRRKRSGVVENPGLKQEKDYYTLAEVTDYYYGRLLPSTGYLTLWDIEPYQDGILLRIPDRQNPERLAERIEQPKTFSIGLSTTL